VARAVFDHADEVHRLLSRLTGGDAALTEDLLQDVFLTALRRQRTDDSVVVVDLPWLLTVARSRFIDHVRAASSRTRREERQFVADDAAVPADVSAVSADQARWMLEQLPDVERWALALAVVDGMPIDELAVVLGRSTAATHSLLARARRRLRAAMEGQP
jgi:RNA polymerase sigma-70 factor, ECF subfamily